MEDYFYTSVEEGRLLALAGGVRARFPGYPDKEKLLSQLVHSQTSRDSSALRSPYLSSAFEQFTLHELAISEALYPARVHNWTFTRADSSGEFERHIVRHKEVKLSLFTQNLERLYRAFSKARSSQTRLRMNLPPEEREDKAQGVEDVLFNPTYTHHFVPYYLFTRDAQRAYAFTMHTFSSHSPENAFEDASIRERTLSAPWIELTILCDDEQKIEFQPLKLLHPGYLSDMRSALRKFWA